MSYSIEVENIKCNGCATSIRNKLLADGRVRAVEVDIEAGRVTLDADDAGRDEVVAVLAHLGYPLVGSEEGLKAVASKAKSFVSCAIGRLENVAHG